MIKIGNIRIGKGIALIRRKRQLVLGVGTMSFIRTVAAEVGGVDESRPTRPRRLRTEFGFVADPWYDESY